MEHVLVILKFSIMKNLFYFLVVAFILFGSAFMILKWDQLQYYFKFGNTDFSKILVESPEDHELNVGQTATYVFNLENTGTNDLNIENVLTECECLIPTIKSSTISSGESTKVYVQFTPEKQGKFIKYAIIEANTAPPLTVLTIEGEVK